MKRRKYDTVNILINCDIILSKRITGGFLYKMKHDVPNSIRDLEMVKNQVTEVENRVNRKRETLKMIKIAEENYRKLIKLNEIRPKDS